MFTTEEVAALRRAWLQLLRMEVFGGWKRSW
jgi:hypothetical protein